MLMFGLAGPTDVPLDRLRHPRRADPPRLWTARPTGVHVRKDGWTVTRTDGLRPIVEALDREMSRLLARGDAPGADTTALLSSWAELVEFLALGPPPELRACPSCGAVGMRAATRCGRCWRKLDPPAPPASA
jgi:hypothetical protein